MPEPTTYRLRFPPELTTDHVTAALLSLAGSSRSDRGSLQRLSVVRHAGQLQHRWQPPARSAASVRQLRASVPGLVLDEVTALALPGYSWRLWLSSRRRPLSSDRPEVVARALLTALNQPLGHHESLRLDWLLGPVERPQAVGNRVRNVHSESWTRALLTASFQSPSELDADARRSLRAKRAMPGWRIVGLISVKTASRARAQQLAAPVLAALRTADGASVHFGIRPSSPRLLTRAPWRFPLQLSIPELAGLLGWPIAEAGQGLPIDQRQSRLLPVALPTATGRILGRSVISGEQVRLSLRDSSQHSYVLGPTGTGKSTWLVNQVLQDIASGYSVLALDAKGQLTDQILARYPRERDDQLVIFDAASPSPVGLNPFNSRLEPSLVADQLLGIFASLYADSWGPRTADVMQAALLTLARSPGTSLAALPLLLTHAGYRRKLVGRIDDPLGVGPFWDWYESLSPEQRQQVIAPSLNKVRSFLVRPNLRAVLGQVTPRFELLDVFQRPLVVLLDLAKGALGPEGSSLLGTTFLSLLWQTTLTRGNQPPERLRPVSLYVDEAQDFLRLPGDVAELLAQARSLRLSVTLAHQHLGQLTPDLREALLANARTRVVFQLASRDAVVLAQGHPELRPSDFVSLPPYETYLSQVAGGAVQPYASVASLPLPKPSRNPAELRARAATRYGRPRAETEDALRRLIRGPQPDEGASPIGSRPRRSS